MAKEVPRAVVVIYRSSPAGWFFAEMSGGCIYRFGPFASERIVNEILPVIYPADLPRETIAAISDCDDATLLRTAQGKVCLPPSSPNGIEQARTRASAFSASSWRALFSRRIQGWMA
ncbi:MAG: hypothetical protein ACN6OP_08450 [Pseudomonadales bacterium]